jgi:hypothetical protein
VLLEESLAPSHCFFSSRAAEETHFYVPHCLCTGARISGGIRGGGGVYLKQWWQPSFFVYVSLKNDFRNIVDKARILVIQEVLHYITP